jgi:pyruvate dehydrogenase E2 component (dihydrolipoamide acetyltransferase)
MAEIIRMPRLSDTMEEGTIISWLKKVGDSVAPGDILAEVETDKATMDLESFHEGVLLYIGVESGAVPVDSIIAVIGKAGEDYKAQLAAESGSSTAVEEKEAPAAIESSIETTLTVDSGNVGERTKASPLAKKIAQDHNINLGGIAGSGEGGRIVKKDVEEAIEGGSSNQNTAPTAKSVPAIAYPQGQSYDIPVSQMRKVIAKRLSESKFQAPHFYLTIECDMERSMDARKAINASGDVKISFNDIVIKACAMALRKHPLINASWQDTKMVVHGDINIGVAVAVEEGLLVPVVHNADMKSMSTIGAEVREYAGRAKDKRLKPEEMSGNTFTISNLGMFGIDEFTAIINPPDACILAVGAIIEKPIVKNGQIVVGNIMKVTLSCDHRVVDGAKGAQFLQTLKNYLENPLSMLA